MLSLRVQTLTEGVKLWEEYVAQAFRLEAQVPQEVYHLRYEDFLDQPRLEFRKMLDFLQIMRKYREIIDSLFRAVASS